MGGSGESRDTTESIIERRSRCETETTSWRHGNSVVTARPSVMRMIIELPWRVLVGSVRIVVMLVGLISNRPRRGDVAVCPAGHDNDLLGAWKCRCGFEYAGHAFAPCRACAAEPAWIACERCGLGIRA